jgi:P27 family predicted phage terminase small subunit
VQGRPPKPTSLKLIEGNRGKRPINMGEPKPPSKIPTCPSHLSPTAKAEWRRLVRLLCDLGMLSEFDRAALAGYCQSYGHWVEAEKKLRESPMLVRMPSEYIQQNPLLTIANKQLELSIDI